VDKPTLLSTRYVSPSGSDSSPGAIAAPWGTLNAAFARLRAGDTLCLRRGTYPMTVSGGYDQILENVSGTASHPITVVNYPGEVAIIQAYVAFRGTPLTGSGSGLTFEGPPGQKLPSKVTVSATTSRSTTLAEYICSSALGPDDSSFGIFKTTSTRSPTANGRLSIRLPSARNTLA
jgi:hypothetical protein